MLDLDLAWFIGLFEGEGTFQIRQNKYADGIAIQMTDLDVLERVKSKFGGTLITAYEQRGTWKKCYKWYLSAEESFPLVIAMLPFLGTRRYTRAKEWIALRIPVRNKKNLAAVKKRDIVLSLGQGLSQREVATKHNVSQPYVAKIAKG